MLIQILGNKVMNKCALCIPRPGLTSTMVQQGYIDALRHLGWEVYVGDPKTKLGCRKLIENCGIQLIMTYSRYGMRQLPIKDINDNNIFVVVEALPLNPDNRTIDGLYELAHEDEPDLVQEIDNSIVHTRIEKDIWPEYMSGWDENNIELLHLPVAGNMVNAVPPTCSRLTDVSMVANFSHRQDIMKKLIAPLFKRLDLLGYSYQAFGDNIWQLSGLNYNGPLPGNISRLAHVYATAKVCPNVHTEQQVNIKACVNERSFTIPLCGGVQVSDNPMITKYLGSHCDIAVNTTDFMNKVINIVEDQSPRFDRIRASVEYVAHRHTYFNRLADLFRAMGLLKFSDEAKTKGHRAAVRHCWEINARLSAEERGVPYDQKAIRTALFG